MSRIDGIGSCLEDYILLFLLGGCMDRWMDGWMDGWMDRQTDRWDGWINGENKTLKTKQEASENKQDLPVFVKQDII